MRSTTSLQALLCSSQREPSKTSRSELMTTAAGRSMLFTASNHTHQRNLLACQDFSYCAYAERYLQRLCGRSELHRATGGHGGCGVLQIQMNKNQNTHIYCLIWMCAHILIYSYNMCNQYIFRARARYHMVIMSYIKL